MIAGWIVQFASYSAAFLFLAGVALAGTLLFAFFMPETAPTLVGDTSGNATVALAAAGTARAALKRKKGGAQIPAK